MRYFLLLLLLTGTACKDIAKGPGGGKPATQAGNNMAAPANPTLQISNIKSITALNDKRTEVQWTTASGEEKRFVFFHTIAYSTGAACIGKLETAQAGKLSVNIEYVPKTRVSFAGVTFAANELVKCDLPGVQQQRVNIDTIQAVTPLNDQRFEISWLDETGKSKRQIFYSFTRSGRNCQKKAELALATGNPLEIDASLGIRFQNALFVPFNDSSVAYCGHSTATVANIQAISAANDFRTIVYFNTQGVTKEIMFHSGPSHLTGQTCKNNLESAARTGAPIELEYLEETSVTSQHGFAIRASQILECS